MLKLLLGMIGVELDRMMRHAAGTALLLFLAALLFGGALIAAIGALFIGLAEAYDPLMAALLVAGLCFALGTIVIVAAYMRMRSSKRRGAAFVSALDSRAAATPPREAASTSASPASASTVLGIAAVGAIVGLILGRRI